MLKVSTPVIKYCEKELLRGVIDLKISLFAFTKVDLSL